MTLTGDEGGDVARLIIWWYEIVAALGRGNSTVRMVRGITLRRLFKVEMV